MQDGKYSQSVIYRMIIAILLSGAVIAWNYRLLLKLYYVEQWSHVGMILNAAIVLLFLSGIVQVMILLFRYRFEEKNIATFVANIRQDKEHLDEFVHPDSLIGVRYSTLRTMWEKSYQINHGSLASVLVAQQSTLASYPRYVHNTLILTGMLGTIISLAIALSGASDLLQSLTDTSGMGTVISGMSSALSTTMTAMFAYVFFGYFYGKLADCQTHVIQLVERVTATSLIPRFSSTEEQMAARLTSLGKKLESMVTGLSGTQTSIGEASRALENVIKAHLQDWEEISSGLKKIDQTMKQGFRL